MIIRLSICTFSTIARNDKKFYGYYMYIHVKEEKMINKVFETGFDVLNKVRETQQEQLDQAVIPIHFVKNSMDVQEVSHL